MNLTIDLTPDDNRAFEASARAEGLSVQDWLKKVGREHVHLPENTEAPFETGRGMFAKYGPAPSAEEIDANRTDMFRNFAQDF